MSIVSESVNKAMAKRITFGIEVKVRQPDGTEVTLNEWGLHESQAKEVNEMLILGNNEPIVLGNMTFVRRAPAELSSALAALKAKLKPAEPAPSV